MPEHDIGSVWDEPTQSDLAAMHAYGITRIPATYYVYNGYTFSNLFDALAQARLEQNEESPSPPL